ncbi:hypothetical protein PoB_000903400 [Plakobranchus ocellatus]|uniref:Uncharacterized protein n=1 Tax=Plakobranchus ocellatus TaxID=259542 RepID=A0AAV3YHQ8_9GAST|nr:hypothetical protein PoB_000903400 [Plakobranchus ocellatus]
MGGQHQGVKWASSSETSLEPQRIEKVGKRLSKDSQWCPNDLSLGHGIGEEDDEGKGVGRNKFQIRIEALPEAHLVNTLAQIKSMGQRKSILSPRQCKL